MRNTKESIFQILPTITFIKYKNTLTKEAKKTFNVNWDKFYCIRFGWLFWEKYIKL